MYAKKKEKKYSLCGTKKYVPVALTRADRMTAMATTGLIASRISPATNTIILSG